MSSHSVIAHRLRFYQQQTYSVHQMSQLLQCSRYVVRRMLANDWNHPAVRAFLDHVPTVPTMPIEPKPQSARSPSLRPQRVAFDDHFHQPAS